MKTLRIMVVLMCAVMLAPTGANAQKVAKFGLFDHYSAGVTVGLGGIGFDAATCITEYVQFRVGAQFFPNVSYKTDFSLDEIGDYKLNDLVGITYPGTTQQYSVTVPQDVSIEGKLGFNSGKVLFDIFPFPKHSNFHLTAGFYYGGGDIVKLSNVVDGVFAQDCYKYPDLGDNLIPGTPYDPSKRGEALYGITLGDYRLKPDQNGNLRAGIAVNKFRPYLGFGFDRAVPRKRVGFMFEMGVQFWGKPTIFVEGLEGRHNVTEADIVENGGDDGGLIKTMNKISVYPMMTFRLCGRII